LNGAVSAQKALQWSKTETKELLGGTEGNIFLPTGQIADKLIKSFFFQKNKQKEIRN